MEKSYPLLKPLTDQLMKEVRAYGILEVSTEQYQTSCNQILNFAQLSQIDHYSPEMVTVHSRSNIDLKYPGIVRGKIMSKINTFDRQNIGTIFD